MSDADRHGDANHRDSHPDPLRALALDMTSYARVMQDVATSDPSVAVFLGAHQSIGMKALLLFGTAEQKSKFLPGLAAGEQIAALGAAGAEVELCVCKAACRHARHAVKQLLDGCEVNDDEEIRKIAGLAYERGAGILPAEEALPAPV